MHKYLSAAALAAVLGMGGVASAADIYSGGGLKDGPAIVTSWTGFYIGLGGGGGAVNHDIKVNAFGSQVAEINGIGGEGGLGTVEVGYDRQFGRIVAGVFFNFDFTSISTEFSAAGLGKVSADLDNMWTVGGRVGYLVNNETLAYALAGYTQANFSLPSGIHGDNPGGFTVGGGLETKLAPHWTLKAEYRFTSFDTETLASSKFFSVTSDTDVHTGRFVLSYKGLFEPDFIPLK
jgi:outer membrane immunogenic protein